MREADSAKGRLQGAAWGQGHLQLPGGPGMGIQNPLTTPASLGERTACTNYFISYSELEDQW